MGMTIAVIGIGVGVAGVGVGLGGWIYGVRSNRSNRRLLEDAVFGRQEDDVIRNEISDIQLNAPQQSSTRQAPKPASPREAAYYMILLGLVPGLARLNKEKTIRVVQDLRNQLFAVYREENKEAFMAKAPPTEAQDVKAVIDAIDEFIERELKPYTPKPS